MKKIIVFITLVLTGCAIHTPKPTPIPCEVKIQGECRKLTAGEKGGAVTRGHGDTPKNDKMMFYIPPEELWPEEFPPAPKVCGSPFRGRIFTR